MSKLLKFNLIAGIAFTCLLPSFAQAQNRDLFNRLNRLENEVQTLNDAYFRGQKPPANYQPRTAASAANAQVEVRLSQIEQQIRALTGQVEQNAFAVTKMQNDLQRALQDMEIRFGDLQRNRSGFASKQNTYDVTSPSAKRDTGSSISGQPTRVVNGQFIEPSRSGAPADNVNAPASSRSASVKNLGSLGSASDPTSAYESAFALLRSGKYGEAEAGFRAFLDRHPDHNLASNAQYWLAETYYVRGNYEQASRGFAIGYQKYPKSSKAADNLLKLGLSLSNSGKKEDACLTFKQLEDAFPNAQTPLKRRVAQEKGRLGC